MADKTTKKAPAKKAAAKKDAAPGKPCSVDKCKRPYRAKGLCVTHYKLWRRGELEGHKGRYKICSKEACRKPVAAHGLCAEHGAKASTEAAPAA